MKFLKNFKKNEIVIYAIALMLVTAGYFNYTSNLEGETAETYSEEYANVGDAQLVNSGEVVENNTTANNSIEEQQVEKQDEQTDEVQETSNQPEEAPVDDNSDYFVSSKMERETNYANMISTYTKILEDNSVSETQKSIAMKEITKINNTQSAIAVCENLISTKGFENSIIFVNDKSVNVVVKVADGLTAEKVAQIQNIISRELNAEIGNIHITEK